MRSLVPFICLVLTCMAQRPHPCRSPPLLTGALTVTTQSEKLAAYAQYNYDALGQRIRIREVGTYENKSFDIDALLLFREGVMFKINEKNRTCCKRKLKGDFHPLEIPKEASLVGQAIVGSSSGPGQGLLVNTWWGEVQMPRGKAQYMSTVTEFGCIPVSTLFHSNRTGWVVTSFMNNVIGIVDPQRFFPPPFCQETSLNEAEEEADFYSVFYD